MTPHLTVDLERCRMPRGALQAAEFEVEGHGYLEVIGRSVSYIDRRSGISLLSYSYPSEKDARMQIKFFRESYRDAEKRRSSFRVVS
jgi:hypothetical protein